MLTISPASVIASKVFALVAEHLNERQRRLLLGAFALVAGRGGITQVAGLTGVARRTVRMGRHELTGQRPAPPKGRVRHAGAGRRRLRDEDSSARLCGVTCGGGNGEHGRRRKRLLRWERRLRRKHGRGGHHGDRLGGWSCGGLWYELRWNLRHVLGSGLRSWLRDVLRRLRLRAFGWRLLS